MWSTWEVLTPYKFLCCAAKEQVRLEGKQDEEGLPGIVAINSGDITLATLSDGQDGSKEDDHRFEDLQTLTNPASVNSRASWFTVTSKTDTVESPQKLREKEPAKKKGTDKGRWVMRMDSITDHGISEMMHINIDNPGKIHTFYQMGKVMGSGSFGTVSRGTVLATGALRAVKSISKEENARLRKMLQKEIEICKMLDHPNIVKLYEVFEDEAQAYLVLELCLGGELFNHIGKKGLQEAQAAVVMRQILRAVCYLHQKSVCHRDLKAENILLAKSCGDSNFAHNVRISDFGLSCKIKPKQVLLAKVGTLSHMAPQVLEKKYNEACDLWSCGVILFHLLSAMYPFEDREEDAAAVKIRRREKVTFGRGWDEKTGESLELVTNLLCFDPKRRYCPREALQSRWFEAVCPPDNTARLDYAILEALRSFRKLNRLKKAALTVIASLLTEPQIRPARLAFLMLDADGDGSISVAELREKLEELQAMDRNAAEEAGVDDIGQAIIDIFHDEDPLIAPPPVDEAESRLILKRSSINSLESDMRLLDFSYTEFLAATFDREKNISEALCHAAFRFIDKDDSGGLSMDELELLLGNVTAEETEQIMREVARGSDFIDFQTFSDMVSASNDFTKIKCFHRNSTAMAMPG